MLVSNKLSFPLSVLNYCFDGIPKIHQKKKYLDARGGDNHRKYFRK